MAPENSFRQPLCAKCQKPGGSACASCRLVTYCSKTCQTTHWKAHKHDCKSPLGKRTWIPAWALGRDPTLFSEGGAQPVFNRKYLFGNTPALDVLNLKHNEGSDFCGDLKVLFAASGDMRNAVQTVASLPETYTGDLLLAINDLDLDIVARNLVMLLLALQIENSEQAVQSIIHIWYSASLRPTDAKLLTDLVYPMIEEVCAKIADRAAGSLQAKTWKFSKSSLRLVLKKESWTSLLSYFRLPPGLTRQRAHDKRVAVTKAVPQIEHFRDLCVLQPEHRVCREKYRDSGIMLPFGYSSEEFTVPNPTLQQSTLWPMNEIADPMAGWTFTAVLNTDAGNAVHDIYGKLYAHLGLVLSKFKHHLSDIGVRFELHNVDLLNLQNAYAPGTFDRIETTNICDRNYLGTDRTLDALGPLLQKRSANPKATIPTLYMMAVLDVLKSGDQEATARVELEALLPYFPVITRRRPQDDMFIHIVNRATGFVRDSDRFFDEFAESQSLSEAGRRNRLNIKSSHSIAEKWPTRLKTRPGQRGWEEEFINALGSMAPPTPRYVEWQRSN